MNERIGYYECKCGKVYALYKGEGGVESLSCVCGDSWMADLDWIHLTPPRMELIDNSEWEWVQNDHGQENSL